MPNTLSDVSAAHHALFPTPASVTDLDSPPLPRTLDAECTASLANALQPVLPDPACIAPTTPHSIEASAQPEMPSQPPTNNLNLIVGGTLAPEPNFTQSLLSPALPAGTKIAKTDLRLPSFLLLGIAAPHPDHLPHSTTSIASRLVLSPEIQSEVGSDGDLEGVLDHGRIQNSNKVHIRHLVTTITPPAETGEPSWTTTTVASAPIDSPETEPATTVANRTAPTVSEVVKGYLQSVKDAAPVDSSPVSFCHEWVANAIQRLVSCRQSGPPVMESLRVLSHALPCPSFTGHVYPTIIQAIHNPTPDNPTTWINVFHAVPGRFSLSDLPLTSPPNTPGPAVNGDDYFTQKFLFDTAVSITDYQQDLSALPRSPRPVVQPSSINVSIVERYIPPSTHHEIADMFDPRGPSVLVDRLVELSPHNSQLIFIYPTRRGGETFQSTYLSPTFGTTLLHMATVIDMSPEVGHAVSNMPTVAKLLDYNDMLTRARGLCKKLSNGDVRGIPKTAKYEIVYSETQEVTLPRRIWADEWWVKQEKTRIRDTLSRYMNMAIMSSTRKPSEQSVGSMTSEILNAVLKNPYPGGKEPTEGIEVSIFIIQRSA